jgi:hypothetical protein
MVGGGGKVGGGEELQTLGKNWKIDHIKNASNGVIVVAFISTS